MKDKPPSPEYRAFENLLGKVLSVSKAELNQRIAQEKREKKTPKFASHVSAVQAKHT
jgi:hypothetical protein